MNKFNFLLIILIAFIFGCNPPSDIDKLKDERANLKAQILEMDEQIRSLDTNDVAYLPLVKVEEASIGRYKHEIVVQGQVKTDQEVLINAEANGIVQSINVKEGEQIKKGQVLAKIDTEILASNINEIQTRLEFAEYAYEKQKELFDRGIGTEFELKQAKNQMSSLKSQLSTIQTQKSKSIVKAPFDGFIDEIFTHTGEMAGAQAPLFRLVNNKNVRLTADISEHYYTHINVGTPIKAYIPTLRDTMDLKVTAIGNYIHPTNRTFRIHADVKENELLLPNMLAQLHITDLVLDSALIIPSNSLLKSQENEDYIFVLHKKEEGYEVEKVVVEIISRHQGVSAIKAISRKLLAGEKIATEGSRGITNGDLVRIF